MTETLIPMTHYKILYNKTIRKKFNRSIILSARLRYRKHISLNEGAHKMLSSSNVEVDVTRVVQPTWIIGIRLSSLIITLSLPP